jgi:thiamine-monophosphate kinase
MSTVLSDLGEDDVVAMLTAGLPVHPGLVVGPGDDAAVVTVAGADVVMSADMLLEGRHFRRDWSSAEDVGHKAAAANLADIVAMGARPRALMLSLGAPADLPTDWVRELVLGIVAEAEPLGCALVGGDTVATAGEAGPVVVSVSVVGELVQGAAVLRSGARPGDLVGLAGRVGWSAAGLSVLRRGFRSPRAVVAAHRRPLVPYEAGPSAVAAGATALIDVSDGLLRDATRLADASAVCVQLDSAALEPDDPLLEVAAALGHDPNEWVLGGGEDHALLACFPSGSGLAEGFRAVGEVQEGTGVTIDGQAPPEGMTGFRHFTQT